MTENPLEILYQDEFLIAINKPNGLLVHKTYIASREDKFALQLLRDQIQKRVYPVHRLDRKTSGVLIFALNSDIAKQMQEQFITYNIEKKYIAIVRGFFPEEILVDYPLINDSGKLQEAVTYFKRIKTSEIPIFFGKHQTSRYSLIEAFPKTGRMHQIRKHCNHLRHPIIGDRPHGCNKQNKLFKETWNMTTMLLHAKELTFVHPIKKEPLKIEAPFFEEFKRIQNILNL